MTFHKKKILVVFFACFGMMAVLAGRLIYLMIFESEYYQELAQDLHERERSIKAARGRIIDRTGTVLADNRTVCTISVIHSQIEDPEAVIQMLCKELGLSEETVRNRVEKVSSIERIQSNVDKEVGDAIRAYHYAGVKVDEDFKRYYPYSELASKVLGFTGSDNQGIIGLEVMYDEYLEGIPGTILTLTDARGIEIENAKEERVESVPGNDLVVSLDYNIQSYAQQEALKVMEAKQADYVSILIMNPQNGEIYACVNVPEFDLNDPFILNTGEDASLMTEEQKQDALNQMWRNQSVNDTYEPGSTFKIFTSSAALLTGTCTLEDHFNCPGYKIVEDRRIRCHKVGGHGDQDFTHAIMNSCNPRIQKYCLHGFNFCPPVLRRGYSMYRSRRSVCWSLCSRGSSGKYSGWRPVSSGRLYPDSSVPSVHPAYSGSGGSGHLRTLPGRSVLPGVSLILPGARPEYGALPGNLPVYRSHPYKQRADAFLYDPGL